MDTLMQHPAFDLLPEAVCLGAIREDDIRTQVWGLLSTLYPRKALAERRREQRYPFPGLIYLTPVAAAGAPPRGESLVVVGKHISERGLGFYHPQPLPYRRMIASMRPAMGTGWVFSST